MNKRTESYDKVDDSVVNNIIIESPSNSHQAHAAHRRKQTHQRNISFNQDDGDSEAVNTIIRLIKSGITSLTRITRSINAWKLPAKESIIKNLIYLHQNYQVYINHESSVL